MSPAFQQDQTPPPSATDALNSSQVPADTPATAALHNATTKYNQLVQLAESSQNQYHKHHKGLHQAYAAIRRLAKKIPTVYADHNKQLQEATDFYAEFTGNNVERLRRDMSQERERRMDILKETKAVERQVWTDHLRCVLGESRYLLALGIDVGLEEAGCCGEKSGRDGGGRVGGRGDGERGDGERGDGGRGDGIGLPGAVVGRE